jgi:hypothetical protein
MGSFGWFSHFESVGYAFADARTFPGLKRKVSTLRLPFFCFWARVPGGVSSLESGHCRNQDSAMPALDNSPSGSLGEKQKEEWISCRRQSRVGLATPLPRVSSTFSLLPRIMCQFYYMLTKALHQFSKQIRLVSRRHAKFLLWSATALLFCSEAGVGAFSPPQPRLHSPTLASKRPCQSSMATSLKLCMNNRFDRGSDDYRQKLYDTFDEMQIKGVHHLKLKPDQAELMVR